MKKLIIGQDPIVIAMGSSSGVARAILPLLDESFEVIRFSSSSSNPINIPYNSLIDLDDPLAGVYETRRPLCILDFRVKKLDCLILNKELDDFRAEIEANVVQRLALIKHFIGPMLRAKKGRFAFFGSELIDAGIPGTLGYTVAKMSDRGMSLVLNAELSRFDILARCFPVGFMRTGLFNELDERKKDFTEQNVSETLPGQLSKEISEFFKNT